MLSARDGIHARMRAGANAKPKSQSKRGKPRMHSGGMALLLVNNASGNTTEQHRDTERTKTKLVLMGNAKERTGTGGEGRGKGRKWRTRKKK